MPLLEVNDLAVHFRAPGGPGPVKAVDGISFALEAGEVLALVGESGSGKSVTALALLGLLPAPAGFLAGGAIRWRGRDLAGLPERELRKIRGKEMALVFQDPMNSLNPVLSCGEQVAESIRIHRGAGRSEALDRALALFREVNIPDPERRLREYPHEMSGGMRQRVGIAMALACDPGLLIADEPTTALDVTVQAQILDLLLARQAERGMALLLITHDLAVVAGTADRVAVMQAGRIVESGPVADVYLRPRHPYTRKLLASIPAGEAEAPA